MIVQQNTTTITEVLFVKEVSERLRCPVRSVLELHRRGRLKAIPFLRPLRWEAARVEKFIKGE